MPDGEGDAQTLPTFTCTVRIFGHGPEVRFCVSSGLGRPGLEFRSCRAEGDLACDFPHVDMIGLIRVCACCSDRDRDRQMDILAATTNLCRSRTRLG